MADVVKEAERQNGPLLDLCKRSTYNPVTRKWFGFSDNYVPDPGDYLKSIWTEIGMPDGLSRGGPGQGRPLIKGKHPRSRFRSGSGCRRSSIPTWPLVRCSGRTMDPSRTRTRTSF